eukprot:scaffold288647_cov47-Prasinocladus_malaysianus.AAC.1
MAAFISTQILSSKVKSLADLPGKRVGTWEVYDEKLENFGIKPVIPLPWDTDEDEDEMIRLLRDGEIDALVLDLPFLQYMAGIDPECNLFVVGEEFAYTHLAMISYSLDLITELNKGLLQAQDKCESCFAKLFHASAESLHVSGLWIVLAMACAVGLLSWGSKRLAQAWIARKEHVDRPAGMPVSGKELQNSEGSMVKLHIGDIVMEAQSDTPSMMESESLDVPAHSLSARDHEMLEQFRLFLASRHAAAS